MNLCEYLFQKLYEKGVEYAFGIPGDFALPLFRAISKSPIKPVIMTHEPSVGFAADAYARLSGLGVAVVTFGAGALNMVNAIAQAYAERSPVLVISAAPEIATRNEDLLIHHKVKTFRTQYEIYQNITSVSALLEDPERAQEEMDRVLDTIYKIKRPGYIEIPKDMVAREINVRTRSESKRSPKIPEALSEAVREIIERINKSLNPVILAGVEIERLGLMKRLLQVVERFNLPVATTVVGKSVFPEHHHNFIGTYMGKLSDPYTATMVEESDCLMLLGDFLTDVNTGFFTSEIKRENMVYASSEVIRISYHQYPDLNIVDLIDFLCETDEVERREFTNRYKPKAFIAKDDKLTVDGILYKLSQLKDEKYCLITDVGDPLFSCIDLHGDMILNPGYYASMGFAVPAAIGARCARPDRKPIALVGDGAFQMTGMEIGTMVKLGLDGVVIVLNNGSYASLEALGGEADYHLLHVWDYVKVAGSLGAEGVKVKTLADFSRALEEAINTDSPFLIEAILDRGEISSTLRAISETVRAK